MPLEPQPVGCAPLVRKGLPSWRATVVDFHRFRGNDGLRSAARTCSTYLSAEGGQLVTPGPYSRTSLMSRMASPTKLTASTTSMMTSPGKVASHQARVKNGRASLRMDAQVGVRGDTPSPRNVSPASARIAAATNTLAWTITGGRAFGKMCLNMSLPFDEPIARPAVTKSSSLSISTIPRMTRAKSST